jgi:hypothetical protein
LNIGTSDDTSFTDIDGAEIPDGDVVYGSGAMLAAGASIDVTEPGIYEVSLDVTWALSVMNDTVLAEFVLDCGGAGVVLSEHVVLASLGNANAQAVQAHTPFSATSIVDVASPGRIECVLQKKLDVATGAGILFNGLDGYTHARAYLVEQAP